MGRGRPCSSNSFAEFSLIVDTKIIHRVRYSKIIPLREVFTNCAFFRGLFSNVTIVRAYKIGLLILEQLFLIQLVKCMNEERYYYCSMLQHKEEFYALVQRRVEENKKFE